MGPVLAAPVDQADGAVVGSLNAIPMGQWFGGDSALPMGGIATVVVRPEWRGRGLGQGRSGRREGNYRYSLQESAAHFRIPSNRLGGTGASW